MLVAALHSANRATKYESLAGRKPVAIRIWYFALNRDLILDRDYDFELTPDIVHLRDLVLDTRLNTARLCARVYVHDLLFDTVFYSFATSNIATKRDLHRARAFARDLDLAYTHNHTLDFALGDGKDLDIVFDTVSVFFLNSAQALANSSTKFRQTLTDVLPVFQSSLDKMISIANQLELPIFATMLRGQPWPAADAPDATWQAFVVTWEEILTRRGF